MVTEKIEWTYTDRPDTPDMKLRMYWWWGFDHAGLIRSDGRAAEGKVNVYYFATSASGGG